MGRHAKNKLIPINVEHEKIGNQLSKIRKARGLTQKQLADKIGVSRSTIADYEHGKNRIFDVMILRIAIALNVTPNDILCFDKENKIDLNPSLRLMKRIQKIIELPLPQQKALLKTLDLALKTAKQAS